ncbi:ComEA family DNA-binding protein [Nonomuraea soli]|uniref:Competence protein ComEA n=1 Tax=Nonomuraea soli TaxID=1032476 RepID=A0A7W0CDA1_9ACTN|nr:ComEA family DNA-binding protein [Nonomuraea soli]MBA2889038.1 competence protein ComEA [Nonomuraea soli]
MRAYDQERTAAETRLRSITSPHEPPRPPRSFQAFREADTGARPGPSAGSPLRALVAVGLLAVLVAAFFVWRAQPDVEPLAPLTPSPPGATTAKASVGQVIVHVAGKVRRPGVYTLAAGSRVADAVEAAGGVRQGAGSGTVLGSVNLARRVVDGEQITVGLAATAAAGAQGDPLVNLNTASPEQLEQLPGVGEVLAQRIAAFRDSHGGFQSVEQLRQVSGIGPRKFEEIRDKVQL